MTPEGNGHEAEFTSDNAYVIGADEDFGPFASDRPTTSTTAPRSTPARAATPAAHEGRRSPAPRCSSAGPAPAIRPSRPATRRGRHRRRRARVCTFTEKVAAVIAAGGYDAVLVFNRDGIDACNGSLGMIVEGDIPDLRGRAREQGFAIFDTGQYDNAACLAGDRHRAAPDRRSARSVTVCASPRRSTAGATSTSTATTPARWPSWTRTRSRRRTTRPSRPGFGDLSVHEVATSPPARRPGLLLVLRRRLPRAEIAGDELVEVGHFIDEGGNNFWGVQVFENEGQEYVAASDRDFGLYIFRYTGG